MIWTKNREGGKKQPYFIHLAEDQSMLMAAIDSTPFKRRNEAEEFLFVCFADNSSLNNIPYHSQPVFLAEAASGFIRQHMIGKAVVKHVCFKFRFERRAELLNY